MRSKKELIRILMASDISDFFNRSAIERFVGKRITGPQMMDESQQKLDQLFDTIAASLVKKEANHK